MVRILVWVAVAGSLAGADFSLTIGPPVAAGTGTKVVKSKGAAFAVRMEECADPAKAQLTATAVGLTNGTLTSVNVMPIATDTRGVYVVTQNWPNEGAWVVSLSATCGSARAGAIVPVTQQGFVRESVQLLPRPASSDEINAALKAHSSYGR